MFFKNMKYKTQAAAFTPAPRSKAKVWRAESGGKEPPPEVWKLWDDERDKD